MLRRWITFWLLGAPRVRLSALTAGGKSSKMSRDLPANQTIILAVNQIVWSLCDTSKTSSEPLLLTVLLTLLCYVPAAC